MFRWLLRCSQYLAHHRRRAVYGAISRAGRYIYSIKLCHVRCVLRDDQIYFRKQRIRRSRALISCSNGLLRHTNGSLYGLSEVTWLRWEQQMASITSASGTEVRGNVLWTRPYSGLPLRQWLQSEDVKLEVKCRAFLAAVDGLRKLHSRTMVMPDGVERRWSHGDAHAGNVFYDDVEDRVVWFDFETLHAATLSDVQRHADDLRALIFSSAGYLPELRIADLVRWTVSAISNWPEREALLRELEIVAQNLQKRPTLFHLAQTTVDFNRHQLLTANLIGIALSDTEG